jgi:hypothetical protein
MGESEKYISRDGQRKKKKGESQKEVMRDGQRKEGR